MKHIIIERMNLVTYSGIGSEGIRISMYIDGNGKIISAFPAE